MLGHKTDLDQLAMFDFGFDPFAENKLHASLFEEVPEALWEDGAADGLQLGTWLAGRVNRTAATKRQLGDVLWALAGEREVEIRKARKMQSSTLLSTVSACLLEHMHVPWIQIQSSSDEARL